MFQEEADQEGMVSVFFEEIDQLRLRVSEERVGLLHAFGRPLFGFGDDPFELLLVVLFVGGVAHPAPVLLISGTIGFQLVDVLPQLHGFMKNGSDRQIEKPLPFRNGFRAVAENPVANFLQVIKKTLSLIVHPMPDIRETELPLLIFSENFLESDFGEKETPHDGQRISIMSILGHPFHGISSWFQRYQYNRPLVVCEERSSAPLGKGLT